MTLRGKGRSSISRVVLSGWCLGWGIEEVDFNIALANDDLLDNRFDDPSLFILGKGHPPGIQVTGFGDHFFLGELADFRDVDGCLRSRDFIG